MTDPSDNETAYGEDQDREPASTAPGGGGADTADRAADDADSDVDPDDVNPATGREYGEID